MRYHAAVNGTKPYAGVLAEVAQTYRMSRKTEDIVWNTYVARPLAAILVAILRRTVLTPNQVTILGALVFVGAVAIWVGWRHPWSFFWGAVAIEVAYLFDCADGQLARLKQMTSPAGAYFDYFIDEIKALLLVGACCVSLWREADEVCWLQLGMVALVLVSVATSLTTFVRRPEYAGTEIKPGESARKKAVPSSLVGKGVWLANQIASYVIHYPSWIMVVAFADIAGVIDGPVWFLAIYLSVYALYVAKTGLGVLWRLGHPRFYRDARGDNTKEIN